MNVMNGRQGCGCSGGNAGNFRGNMNQRNVQCRQNVCGMDDERTGCGQNGSCGRSNCRMEEERSRGCGSCGENVQRMMDSCADDSANCGNDPIYGMPLAMGYVPWQQWRKIYNPEEGLCNGTIFPELNLQFFGCIPKGWPNGRGGRA